MARHRYVGALVAPKTNPPPLSRTTPPPDAIPSAEGKKCDDCYVTPSAFASQVQVCVCDWEAQLRLKYTTERAFFRFETRVRVGPSVAQ